MRAIPLLLVVMVLMGAGCNGPKTSAKSTDNTLAAAVGQNETNRCVVPSPSKAPPPAHDAEKCPPDPIFGGLLLRTAKLSFPQAEGTPDLIVEVAKSPEETSRGLMYRTHLPENHGMLFDFRPQKRIHSFWMRNTCISLDMLFIDEDGFIAGIIENVPPLNDRSRSIPCPVSYVLEVNAGWSRRHGVTAGQTVALPR